MTTRSALEICEDLRDAQALVSKLEMELRDVTGMEPEEFLENMRQLIDGGISVQLVRLGQDELIPDGTYGGARKVG